MTTYPEAAARLHLEVCTPNEQLFARLRGKYDITIAIAPGYAERVGDAETATQLGRLSRLLFLHRADRLRRLDNEILEPGSPRPETERDREFARRYEGITVAETSADGTVGLTAIGLTHWTWGITRGTAELYGGQHIATAATEVANKVALQLAEDVRRLKVAVYHDHG